MTPGYSGEVADLYDFAHIARGKDYQAEAAALLEVATRMHPNIQAVLDVACGTGHHLAALASTLPRAVGIDLSEDMCRRAASIYPHLTFQVGDMRHLKLEGQFDLVTCLFSSIGHMATFRELALAVGSMCGHLAPGGLCVIDPWWTPDKFLDGHVSSFTGNVGNKVITRVSHSKARGTTSVVSVDYLVTTPEDGSRHLAESHEITMFREEEYLQAFEAAGYTPKLVSHDVFPRGLYIARGAD